MRKSISYGYLEVKMPTKYGIILCTLTFIRTCLTKKKTTLFFLIGK